MDKQEEYKEILKRVFPGILESEADEMVAAGHIHTYNKDTVLTHEGALESTFYIIINGEVQVTKLVDEGEVRVMKHLQPGDFFGEMAIIHKAPRAATVTTTKNTTVLEIEKDAFESMVERSSSMSNAMVREVSRRLIENDEMAIQDLRQKARELATAYQQLTDLEAARREFLTTIAHELRTPLMAASGFMQVIRAGMLHGEALDSALGTVARNIQEIITKTNDILFLQEMDLIMPAFQSTDVGFIVAQSVEQIRAQAERNKVGLRMNIAPNLPQIPADAKSLERAVSAILDNAIKFSPDGGDVLVDVKQADAKIQVRIQDHGVGIPAESMPRIFDRFFHLDKVGGHLFRGVGLGLSIARQVVEQHQGQIDVVSELGKGSAFTISFPVP